MVKRRCPLCGSRQWHKEPISGSIACEEGHILQNYRNEAEDVGDEWGQGNFTKRTMKSRREKKIKSRANPDLYHGLRARRIYFQCLQLVLRHQIEALTKLWKLPPEFEAVCRETWALYLSILPEPLPGKDTIDAAEEPDITTQTTIPDSQDSQSTEKKQSLFADGSDSDLEAIPPIVDPELDNLLRETYLTSSSSEGEGPSTSSNTTTTKIKSRRRGMDSHETLSCTLVVLIIGCWTLKIPVMTRDFLNAVEMYNLPYLEGVKYIPKDLRKHLNKWSVQALSPPHAPRTTSLHALVSDTCKRLHSVYSLHIPEMNAAPVLWRITQHMAGTPMLYCLTKRLAECLALPLTLHQALAPTLENTTKGQSTRFGNDNVAPELSLLATLIIVLKLVYGTDGKPRVPADGSDPACVLPTSSAYRAMLKRFEQLDATKEDHLFSSKHDLDVANLPHGMLDAYLDFCGRALIEEKPASGRVLDTYFPLASSEQRPHIPAVHVQPASFSDIPVATADPTSSSSHPGEEFEIFRSQDVLGVLPNEYGVMIARGSQYLGIEEERMNDVIEQYERRLDRWSRKRRLGAK